MYYRPYYSIYDPYFPRFYPTYAEVALDVVDAQNRILNREVSGLVKDNIRLRTQILERDYQDLDKTTGVNIGLSRQAKLQREKKMFEKEKQQKRRNEGKNKRQNHQRRLQREYSFGSLHKVQPERRTSTPTKYERTNNRHTSLQLKQKPFDQNKKYQSSKSPRRIQYYPSSTFIDGLDEEKLNPQRNVQKNVQTPTKKQKIPPSVHLISEVKSVQYYNEQQAHSGKKNNEPYLFINEKGQEYSPYKKFRGNFATERKRNEEQMIARQSTTNKKQFLSIFSKALESVRQKNPEKEEKKQQKDETN